MLEKLPDAVGHALRDRRAGLDKIAFNHSGLRTGMAAIEVTSMVFSDHAPIPPHYTADGDGISPPLQWKNVPPNAASLALIVEDADAPTPQPLVHAIVVDLAPTDGELAQGALKSSGHEGQQMHAGRNSFFMSGWLPPDPPPGHGVHRYAFQIFALGAGEPFRGTPGRDDLMKAVHERGIASGCLIGTYERPDTSIKTGAAEKAAATTAGLAGMPRA